MLNNVKEILIFIDLKIELFPTWVQILIFLM